MLTTEDLDAAAAVLFTLGQFHRNPPDQTTLDTFSELIEEWPTPIGPNTEQALDHFRASRANGETPEQIDRDHNWLYGVSATAKVPPYESVHRGRDGLLFDEETLQVRAIYRQMGFQVQQYNKVPDDHVGIEMEFLAQCCLRALDATDEGDTPAALASLRLARVFLDDHVMQWAPRMLQLAAERAETDFMKGVCMASIDALGLAQKCTESLPAA